MANTVPTCADASKSCARDQVLPSVPHGSWPDPAVISPPPVPDPSAVQDRKSRFRRVLRRRPAQAYDKLKGHALRADTHKHEHGAAGLHRQCPRLTAARPVQRVPERYTPPVGDGSALQGAISP